MQKNYIYIYIYIVVKFSTSGYQDKNVKVTKIANFLLMSALYCWKLLALLKRVLSKKNVTVYY